MTCALALARQSPCCTANAAGSIPRARAPRTTNVGSGAARGRTTTASVVGHSPRRHTVSHVTRKNQQHRQQQHKPRWWMSTPARGVGTGGANSGNDHRDGDFRWWRSRARQRRGGHLSSRMASVCRAAAGGGGGDGGGPGSDDDEGEWESSMDEDDGVEGGGARGGKGTGGKGSGGDGGAGGVNKPAVESNKPPERDTGIAKEKDMGLDLEGSETNGTDDEGNSVFRKSGVDRGDGGYRCNWTVKGSSAADGTWEYRETCWEKGDASGYKELGAEKSGFNELGDTWWETWKEVYRKDEFSSVAHIERSADKWARDPSGREWHEKWWERYNATGYVERGVEKSGRHGAQAWWEKWGEQVDSNGGDSIKWTDKWAENGAGTRWGDKWEERFGVDGGGKKEGETWRVSAGGERWSRTWGEVIGSDGTVRKYGQSTSGEQWDYDTGSQSGDGEVYYDRMPGYSWGEAVENSSRLLSIEIPEAEEEEEEDGK